jgi:hypothetical protein
MTDEHDVDIAGWIHQQMQRMTEYEQAAWAVPLLPEREVAACWVLRALGDPSVPGSEDVLDAIYAHREHVRKMTELRRWRWEQGEG